MSEKRRIVENTLANGVAQFAQMASALVFIRFLVNAFGATDFGLYLLASSIGGYAMLLDLGVGASVVKRIAESRAKGDDEATGRVVSSALAFYVLIGMVGAIIMLIMALNTRTLFPALSVDSARLLQNLFLVSAAWQLWAWPASTASSVLAGHQLYKKASLLAVMTVCGTIVVTVVVLVTHQGPLLLLAGTFGVTLLVQLVQIAFALRALAGARLSIQFVSRNGFMSIFSFAWAVFVVQVCSIIVYQQTDRLVIGVFLGAAAITLYEAAGKFQGFVSQLTTMSVSAVMPMASHLDAQGQQELLRQLFLRGTKYSLMLLSPVVIGLMVVARPLLLVWLGPMFAAQAISAQILISHQLLTGGTAVGDSMIVGLGQLPKRVPYVVGMAALNLALSIILVQKIGILGVVLGTTIPWVLDYPFHMRVILRALDVPIGRWLKETVLPTYPLLLLPALLSWVLLTTRLQASFAGVAAIGIVSVGAYWLAVYAFTFQPNERADVRSALSAVWQRIRGGQAPA